MRLKVFTSVVLLICLPLTTWGVSLTDERNTGKEINLEVLRSFRLNNDPYVCIYVGSIGKRLEPAANLPWPIRLTVVESITPNAFATMGGYAYVTTGLIEMSDREDELAGVLAHELAHLGKHHVVKRMEKEKPLSIATVAAVLLSVLVPGGAAVQSAVMAGSMAASQTLSLKYSREDEDEADRVGLATAERAGYSGTGISDFLKKMRSTEYEKTVPQYLLTHPYSEDRAARIDQMATLKTTTVNTDFFPYVVVRLKVLDKQFSPTIEDTWLKKHQRDPKDPVSAYGAALVYTLKGSADQAVAVIRGMDSPYRELFLGEVLIRGQKFREAAEVLADKPDPISRYFLALALEGSGAPAQAAEVLKGLMPYTEAFPLIYQKYAMVVGRLGFEGLGFEYLGRYYMEIGRQEVARQNFQKALEKYGRNTPEGAQVLALLQGMNPKEKEETKNKNEKSRPGP